MGILQNLTVDIIFLITTLIGCLFGMFGNWWRRLITIIVFVCLLVTGYFFFFDYATKFVQYDLINFVVEKGWISELSFTIQEDFTFRISNVEDIFILLQNIGLDPQVLKSTCEGLTRSIIAFIGVTILSFASEIISFLLYWMLFRWIMPRKVRHGFISKILGIILGGGYAFVATIFALSFSGSFMGPITEKLLPEFTNTSSALYAICTKLLPEGFSVDELSEYIRISCNLADPLSEGSNLVKFIFETLNQMGLSPFKLISVDLADETGEVSKVAFKETFNLFITDVVENGLPKLDAIVALT